MYGIFISGPVESSKELQSLANMNKSPQITHEVYNLQHTTAIECCKVPWKTQDKFNQNVSMFQRRRYDTIPVIP